MAGQGPAAHPAAVAVLVDADHLKKLGVGCGGIEGLADPDGSRWELDAVALVKVHGQAATRGNGSFLIISTAPWGAAAAPWGSADKGWSDRRCGRACAMAKQAGGRGRSVNGLSRLVDAARDRTLPMGSLSIVRQIGGME